MSGERWRELQDLFTAARAVDGDARERLLQQRARENPSLVAEVRSLLAADAQPGIMDALAPELESVAGALQDTAPERIGPYRMLGEIGRGGMGVVYLAERADGQFVQRVAIKLIETSDAADPLHQRFLAERQILAGLVHPNIARLLDGGITGDGRPYLVMEYVDGLPITTYCDRHRLDIRARLRLFADVCAAVQHAHQNLVIHRDLKPGNILVSTDARVHLLDFGIAKLMNPALTASPAPLTRAEWRIMTPEYASPEQVRGESLTTASDIYSLGILLYELLCGQSPYKITTGSAVEIAKAICEQDPERPSVRVRVLDGDLDSIALKALRKEPGRRYASADMFRQDIDRYLAGLPVLAHRGSRRYRLGKFWRRHRVETTAAALVLAALVAGLTIAIWQGRRATRERDRAEHALAESTEVTNFLVELFQTGDPGDVPASQLSALDLLQRGAARADELSSQPIVRARLLDVIGQMSFHLGRLDEAQGRFEQAVALRRAAPGGMSLDLATSLIHLSWVHRTRSDLDRARPLVTEALEIRRRALPANHPDVADALYELGWLSFQREQERLYREALTILTAAGSAADRQVTLLLALATNLRRQGRLTEAVAAAREAFAIAERSLGPAHHVTGSAMIHLGDHVHDIEQDAARAEQLYRTGLAVMTRHFGDSSIRLIHGLNSLAGLLSRRRDVEAERLYRQALSISQSATGPEHPRVAERQHRLAGELARQGRLSEAESLAKQALELSIRTVGARHPVIATSRLPLLADIYDLQGRHAAADETYRAAFEQLTSGGVMVGQMHRDYGLLLLRRTDHPRAEQQLLRSLTVLEQAYPAGHPNVDETKRALMELYRQMGKPASIERYRVPPGRFVPY